MFNVGLTAATSKDLLQNSEAFEMDKSNEIVPNPNELVHLLLISRDTEIGLRNELTQLHSEFAKFKKDIYSSKTWRIGRFILGIFGRRSPEQND